MTEHLSAPAFTDEGLAAHDWATEPLRRVQEGDFREALPVLRGPDEAGLSPASIARLTASWEAESDLTNLQNELKRQAGKAPEPSGPVVDIGGLRPGPKEVERRPEAAFDRLVRRSLESRRNLAAPLAVHAFVGDD